MYLEIQQNVRQRFVQAVKEAFAVEVAEPVLGYPPSVDMGELGRTVGVNCPTYNECRTINIIIKPLELPDHGDESLHRVLNSLTNSESSIGSWDLSEGST